MLRTFVTTAIFVLGITTAYADDASTNVSFGDLNLSQPADAKILADRLQDAAKSVCLKTNPENSTQAAIQYCVDMAVHMAMARIESSLDQAVHAKLVNVRTAMQSP